MTNASRNWPTAAIIRTVGTLPVTSFAAGVDVRTVAGRLGHSGGGTTTLRVYAAWIAEADQRAAAGLSSRMPSRPAAQSDDETERVLADPRAPYERIAVELRSAILGGRYTAGEPLPTIKQLADTYQVATGTAHRALSLLADWGLVDVSRGQRATVRVGVADKISINATNMAHDHECSAGEHQDDSGNTTNAAPRLWEITLRGPDGRRYPRRHVCADINQPDSFRGHLLAIARIEAPVETDDGDSWINNYELEITEPGGQEPKLVLRW